MSDMVTTHEPEGGVEPEAREEAPQADAEPTLELDCRGMNCPLPILKTKKAIDTIEVGQVLKMISTDPGAIPDIAAFSRRTGHQIVQQSEGDGEYVFWLRRS